MFMVVIVEKGFLTLLHLVELLHTVGVFVLHAFPQYPFVL